MRELIKRLEELKISGLKRKVDRRLGEFKDIGKSSEERIFSELCFCLLTANFNAGRAIMIQQKIGDGFISLSREELSMKLRELGYRYPEARAGYIVEARRHIPLGRKLEGLPEKDARDWLVENVKGLGMKEASHFLRNIGYKNLAIIDFHIVDLLSRHGLIPEPKRPLCLTKRRYIEIEEILGGIACEVGMTLAELDLYLWYMETGKVLK